ncbi:MAG: Z1 domain-containing protein [Deltaproteobacteria bacterium]
MNDAQVIFDSMVAGGKSPDTVFATLIPLVGREAATAALKTHEQQAGRIFSLKDPLVIHQHGHRPWYTGPREDDRFWPSLVQYLENKGWSDSVIESIDHASSKILANMQPAGSGRIDTRGLVIGYVQSGKTANFTALIAKAADVGYRLFIVLAGIHDALREQTQKRLYRELVESHRELWATLTNDREDFRASAGGNTDAFLSRHSSFRILCVVKKNHAVLRRLKRWLSEGSDSVLSQCPVLIIDDEADQAGLNASKDPTVRTVTNRLILEIMGVLPKAAYVGYTATPFANVLVDPSGVDLYPKDFIVELPRPAGYFGAQGLFGRLSVPFDEEDVEQDSEFDMIRTVPQDEIQMVRPAGAKARALFVAELADSLATSIEYFALATAARRARGQDGHSSMLVHTTLYTDAHEKLGSVIAEHWRELGSLIQRRDSVTLQRLQRLWDDESARVPSADVGLQRVTFDALGPFLESVIGEGVVVIENSASAERLSYDGAPKIQLAVGGNTMSRGLTLEGLVTSYYVRSASAYDTLLQMGRWFGYRTGYEDLPRVWMTRELSEDFRTLATVEEEIRRDVRRYANGYTPLDLAVRIRTHSTLAVTSALKMQHAIDCEISYAGGARQATVFDIEDRELLEQNLNAAERLISAIESEPSTHSSGRYYWEDVPADLILEFVRGYRFNDHRPDLDSDTLCRYIEAQRNRGYLDRWTVVLASVKQPKRGTRDFGNLSVNLLNRSRLARGSGKNAPIGTITTQTDLAIGLEERRNSKRDVDDPPALLLYPIAKDSGPLVRPDSSQSRTRVELSAVEDVLAVAFDFPETKHPTPQRYVKVDLPVPEIDEEEMVDVEADED